MDYTLFIGESVTPIAETRFYGDMSAIIPLYLNLDTAEISVYSANGYEWIKFKGSLQTLVIRVSNNQYIPENYR